MSEKKKGVMKLFSKKKTKICKSQKVYEKLIAELEAKNIQTAEDFITVRIALEEKFTEEFAAQDVKIVDLEQKVRDTQRAFDANFQVGKNYLDLIEKLKEKNVFAANTIRGLIGVNKRSITNIGAAIKDKRKYTRDKLIQYMEKRDYRFEENGKEAQSEA